MRKRIPAVMLASAFIASLMSGCMNRVETEEAPPVHTVSENTSEMMTEEEADKLAEKGDTVLISEGEVNVHVKTDKKDTASKSVKSDEKKTEDKAENNDKKPGTAAQTNGAAAPSGSTNNAARPSNTTQTTKPGAASQPTNKPASSGLTNKPAGTGTPAHTHSWVAVTKTVHHDAAYTTKWVQDTPAWDEQVLVTDAWDEPVTTYTQVEHEVCYGCGCYIDDLTNEETNAHMEAHALAGENEGFYTMWETIPQTTYVHHNAEYKTVHHEAAGHNEQVLTKAAWDETVTAGYKCSCGATK